MKNISRYIIVILSYFFFILNADAGVCKGEEVSNSGSTCNSMKVNIELSDFLNKQVDKVYFLRPGYEAIIAGDTVSAFCLDPGSARPEKNIVLSEIRELGNESTHSSVREYDSGIYNMYQLFYKKMNSGELYDDFVLRQRAYFEYASRVWTIKAGFDTLDKSKYTNDPANFKTCSHYIDSSVKSVPLVKESYCFGNNKEGIKEYYNAVNTTIWENPLQIEKNSIVEEINNKKYYKYIFKISFKNENYHFFDSQYTNGIHYRDINIGSAYFSIDGFFINDNIQCSNNDQCYDYSGNGQITSGDSAELIVVLSEEQFNEYKNEDDSVNVTMKYSYRHPLNIENLFTASYELINEYQRMLIIKDYIHEDKVTIGNSYTNEDEEENESVECVHDANGFVDYNNNSINLSNFLESCGCKKVNTSILSSSELDLYNSKCSSTLINESYYGSIDSCSNSESYDSTDSNTNFSSYVLGYKNEYKINDYCTVKCDEKVDIKDLKGRYIVDAGRYFSFAKYPELNGSKECITNIDYTKFKNDYKSNLEILKDKYNEWQEAKAASTSLTTGTCNPHSCPPCGDNGCKICYDTLYKYNYSYNEVIIENDTKLNTKYTSGYKESCGSPIDWKVADKLSEFQKLSANINSINNLKTSLMACNNYLINQTNDQFYDFQNSLRYYYYQTYSNNEIGTIKNSERNLYGGIDDSEFASKSAVKDNNLIAIGTDKVYSILNETGVLNENIKTYETEIKRTSNVNVKYLGPKVNKSVGVYTGDIMSSTKSNYINLGYKYDIDISAVSKKGNVSYYEFSKLGSSDNNIFNHFKTKKNIIRYCDFEIKNNIIDNKKPNFYYRIVDPSNIDPNGRLTDGVDNGFKNWDNIKGSTVINELKNKDIYNPSNLEYSFSLDSNSIKAIREYNKDVKYSLITSTSSLECNNAGNECLSSFVQEAVKDSPNLNGKETTKFATDISGSNIWKYLECTSSGCSIKEYKRNNINYNSLDKYVAKQKILRDISNDNTINP